MKPELKITKKENGEYWLLINAAGGKSLSISLGVPVVGTIKAAVLSEAAKP